MTTINAALVELDVDRVAVRADTALLPEQAALDLADDHVLVRGEPADRKRTVL